MNKTADWLKQNARPLEIAQWNFLFNGHSRDDITAELLKFQNADGGFGNGLEADITSPLSSAIASAEAIFTACEYGLDISEQWFSNLVDYFHNTYNADLPYFFEPVTKEVLRSPHAPWWDYQPPNKFSPNPCAIIATALGTSGAGNSIRKAVLQYIESESLPDMFDCFCLMAFMERGAGFSSEHLEMVKRYIGNIVCYDSDKWGEYNAQPLDFAHSPDSIWYDCVKDGINKNIEYWLKTMNNDGVWLPNFSWGDNTECSRQATKI